GSCAGQTGQEADREVDHAHHLSGPVPLSGSVGRFRPPGRHREEGLSRPRSGPDRVGSMTIEADREQLIEAIKRLAVVHQKVTLSSGKEADYYIDMRRVTLDGAAAPLVGRVMRDLTADLDFDAVGGLTLGADPVGY